MNTLKKCLMAMFLAVLASVSAMAKPVDEATADRVARTFMTLNGVDGTLVDVTSQTPFSHLYIFTAEGGGFVLVSRDDCAMPILAYSSTSGFDVKRLPDNVREQLELYEAEIEWLTVNGSPSDVADQWQALLAGALPEPSVLTAVAPLLSTTWDQYPYYNNLCPYHTASGERSVTGCVATAAAQVMKKWNHPATGYGSHTYTSDRTINGVNYYFPNLTANFGTTNYQWSSMPTVLTGASSNTQVNAVATLMYHIGVAIEMMYSPVASGAYTHDFGDLTVSAETALQQYFKYRSDMAVINREDYSNAEWIALLEADLDAGRPILFSGRDPEGGHSFVLDGYNNSNQFHVNWGWGSWCDGYYAMGSLNPGAGGTGGNNGTYNLDNVAVTHVQPNTGWSQTGITTVNVSAIGDTGCSVSGGGSYQFGDTIEIEALAAMGYRFTGWSDGHKYNPRRCIANGGTLSFTAEFEALGGDTVTYCPGNYNITSWATGSNTTWGIRIPSAATGDTMRTVQFYATSTGSYTLTIYSGASSPTNVLYTTTFTVSDYGWCNINIGGVAMPATSDVWVMFNSSESYPAAVTYGCGNSYGRVWGSNFATFPYSDYTFMIRAIFGGGANVNPPDPPNPPANECIITSFPYTENFEDQSTYSCLFINDANSDSVTWGLVANYGVNSSICAFIRYAEDADDYLILPPIATSGSYTATWAAKAFDSSYPETYEVLVGGTVIFSETLFDTTFVTRTASFTVAEGDTVSLMFRYVSDDMYYFFLDDIDITQGTLPPDPPIPPANECIITSFPYTENFEDQSTYSCLFINDANGDSVTWGLVANYGMNNSICAFIRYAEDADDYLILPPIATPGSYTVTWAAKAFDSSYPETYEVLVGGTVVFSETLFDTTFVTRTASFTVAEGDTVSLMFRYVSDDMFYFFLDDIVITQGTLPPNPPMPHEYTVTVVANNSNWGSVSGSGTYQEGTDATLMATANSGYHFDHWGTTEHPVLSTANPLTITVSSDMNITAFFEADSTPQYTITVTSNNNAWGTVSGGGTFDEGAVITITATANSGYRFVRWNDGDTNATRAVTVTANATYTATFEAVTGIGDVDAVEWSIYPNPASDIVTIVGAAHAVVTVTDMTGREIASYELGDSKFEVNVADMAPGAYFVRIAHHGTTVVRKLIVK